MSESIEEGTVEYSDRDILDITQLQSEPDGRKPEPEPEPPQFHPILMVWREVLRPAAAEQHQKVTPQWATRICAEYGQLRYEAMNEFRDLYFGKLAELGEILDDEIATDDQCLSYSEPADDAENNSGHYRNLLLAWQMAFLRWEMSWDTTASWAAAELAAISETHKMFFGPTGITAFLDNIGFEYTEADQERMREALEEFRGERS